MNRILMILAVLALIAAAWFGYWAADAKADYLESQRLLREEEAKTRVLTEAMVELQRSNEREEARLDRALRNIERIHGQEVTTGCGPVVHDAIDRLRDGDS